MSREFESEYQPLQGYSEAEDEVEEAPPGAHTIQVLPNNRSQWNHIENLDDFFNRIYQYHQRNGFLCMVLQDVLQLVQFAFVVMFTTFLFNCVNYDVLFYDRLPNNTSQRISLPDGFYSTDQCLARFDAMTIICLIVAGVFWICRLAKVVYNFFKYTEIRAFYTGALKITAADLCNVTWHEVQKRLLEVQRDHQMCVHKPELNQLDIYHRILRFKNYLIALVNKGVLPVKHQVPIFGEMTFMTTGLRFNLDILLFWGPWAPFENYWHLNPDYKQYANRTRLAQYLSDRILWVGVANFVLLPLIFLWQILYSFFRYAEIVRREPGALGARRWSMYARLYLRHFNELDHEFTARLNRGYRPADKYMSSFISPVLSVIAKHIAFVAGSVLAVLIILTLVDEDFLSVSHILTMMGVLGATVAICRALIPDENMVWCPELLMRAILAQIHYMPDSWKGMAHTTKVRDEFAQLFQYKAVYLLEELFSPIITPFVLCFSVRSRAQDIVDFYRNHTIEVIGVGDVCAFAQMDIRKHGNPMWVPENKTEADSQTQAEGGKVELSLAHFTLTNPEWKPPDESQAFMQGLKDQVQRDAAMMSLEPLDNPLANSLHSLTSLYPYTSMLSSVAHQNMGASARSAGSGTLSQERRIVRGSGVKNSEGPLVGSAGANSSTSASGGGGSTGLLASLHQAQTASAMLPSFMPNTSAMFTASMNPMYMGVSVMRQNTNTRGVDEETLEFLSNEMSFSALYMHELHQRRLFNPLEPYLSDAHERELWSTPEQAPVSSERVHRTFSGEGYNVGVEQQSSNQAPGPSLQTHHNVPADLSRPHKVGVRGRGLTPKQDDLSIIHSSRVPGPQGPMPFIPEASDETAANSQENEQQPLIPTDLDFKEL